MTRGPLGDGKGRQAELPQTPQSIFIESRPESVPRKMRHRAADFSAAPSTMEGASSGRLRALGNATTIARRRPRGNAMTKIVVFGAGKIADVVHASLAGDPTIEIAGFTCDPAFVTEKTKHGLPLVPFDAIERTFPPDAFAMFVALGYHELNALRAERCAATRAKGYRLVSWVSPRVAIDASTKIGENCLVFEGASVQPYATLGDGVFVWSGAIVAHHATVGDYCWLASNSTVSSSTVLGSHCFLGVNVAIGHGLKIGARCIFGAGAVATRDTAPDGVYIAGDTERFRLDSQHFVKFAKLL
jgi:sugar O-acyltransferase (sialic acid O-acetyltransferase NeuD family)